jgi:hypothetical protein
MTFWPFTVLPITFSPVTVLPGAFLQLNKNLLLVKNIIFYWTFHGGQGWGGPSRGGWARKDRAGEGRVVFFFFFFFSFFLGRPSFSWRWLKWRSHGLPTLVLYLIYKYKHGVCVCVCVCVCLSAFTFSKLPSLPNLPKLLFTEQGKVARAAAKGGRQHGLATCFFQQLPFYCIHFNKK